MGWLAIILLSALVLLALWRLAGFGRPGLQLTGAALLLAMAGYAWQGRPALAGRPVPPPARAEVPETAFAATREDMLGRVDRASFWLTMADSYHRRGDTYGAAAILRSGIRAHPKDPDLWVGLGNALVIHGDGMMTPAAELAFNRAAALAPDHPGPKFFYGLALAQGGRLEEAERIWLALLATAPADAEWRPMVAERVQMIGQLRAMSRMERRRP
ncbi:MAG TPA: tetratricopeptide repeat protein [Allosphingosinicella sp.]|jgi:cytochrome c-type biogenesis protein CcmH/NrfG